MCSFDDFVFTNLTLFNRAQNALLDSFKKATGISRKEYVKLFAISASIQGDLIAPFLPKIMVVISRLLRVIISREFSSLICTNPCVLGR